MSRMPGPAERLVGETLNGRWEVLERIEMESTSHAVAYRVRDTEGREAFAKAVDFSRATEADDVLKAVEEIASTARQERNLVDRCAKRNMSRVVRRLDSGEIAVEDYPLPVTFIVFELADGDVRSQLREDRSRPLRWRLETLHHAAVGLRQLHAQDVFHQNVKASKILTFADGQKLSGLAHACDRGATAPLYDEHVPGDQSYAPPEALFQFALEDVRLRRHASDMYLFGSLIPFLFQQVNATTALLYELARPHHPMIGGDSFEQALPHLVEAFDRVVEKLAKVPTMPPLLVTLFRELCYPDPRLRGDIGARSARYRNQYSLEPYVSKLAGLLLRSAPGELEARTA